MKKRLGALAVLCLLCVSLAGCPAGNGGASESRASSASSSYSTSGSQTGAGDVLLDESSEEVLGAVAARKIIREATLTFYSDDFSQSAERLNQKAAELGGYLSDVQSEANDQTMAASMLTYRIPAESFDSFMKTSMETGSLISQNISSDDVTDSYFDTETRLTSKRKELARLESLLDKAGTLTEVLTLEKEIASVTTDIELLEGSLRKMNNLVSYSTVTIVLQQKPELYSTPIPEAEITFGERAIRALSETWLATKAFAQGFVIVLIRLIPLLILAAIAFLLVYLIRKYRKLHPKPTKPSKHATAKTPQTGKSNLPPAWEEAMQKRLQNKTEEKDESTKEKEDSEKPSIDND